VHRVHGGDRVRVNEFEGRGEGRICAHALPVMHAHMQCSQCEGIMEVVRTLGATVKCVYCGSPEVYDFEGVNVRPTILQ